jgi:hypothetical protein
MPKIQIAVEYDDGRRETVTVGRPADLIAFADEFRKLAPETNSPDLMRESAWLVHRALKVQEPFMEWVETLAAIEPGATAEDLEDPTTPAEEPETTDTPEEQPTEEEPEAVAEWPRVRAHRTIATRTESASLA